MEDTVKINIGGVIFETLKETLSRLPNTRLGRLNITDPNYNELKEHYFFDRNPYYFQAILDLYRFGSLHLPDAVCGATLKDELEFWEIPVDYISDCCLQTYYKHANEMEVINTLKDKFESPGIDYNDKEYGKWINFKRKVWLILDQPNSSTASKVYNVFFLGIVLLSSLVLCLESLGTLRDKIITDDQLENILNTTDLHPILKTINFDNPKEKMYFTSRQKRGLDYIEMFCFLFFTLELIVHFMFCPIKTKFFRNPLNVLDLTLVVKSWVAFAMEQADGVIYASPATLYIYVAVKVTSILRLLRFFRLAKQYNGLRILFIAVFASMKELVLLFVVFLLACFIFANFIFYAEFWEPTTFPNMFYGMWWAVVTMTTLGYGDHYPKSPGGYVIGSLCSMCGLLILAMPIAIMANNFNSYYMRNKERNQLKEEKRKQGNQSEENMKHVKKAKLQAVSPLPFTDRNHV